MTSGVVVRPATEDDADWIREQLVREFVGPLIERGDELIDAMALPALISEIDGVRAGLATLILHPDCGEVLTLNAAPPGRGVGSATLEAAESWFVEHGRREARLFVINSNVHALGFYQRRGYRLWAVHRDSITRARELRKPEIPLYDTNGILIADEIEIRKPLT